MNKQAMTPIAPGDRYGKRVVVRREAMVHGGVKRWGVVVRCDCGRVDLVNKYSLVTGRAPHCVDCRYNEKSTIMLAKRRAAREK